MGPSQKKITILLAFGPTMVGELYAQALSRIAGFRVLASVTTVNEALHVARGGKVSVALISSTLKDGPLSGITALQAIRRVCPTVRCVVILDRDDGHLALTAFRAGAKGVICSVSEQFNTLSRCIKQVYAGQVWANSSQLQEVLEELTRRAPARVISGTARLLTRREEEIAHLVQDGMTNRQIAIELRLSEHTVRNNLFRIFDKLGVSTRVELALYVFNHSLSAPNDGAPKGKGTSAAISSAYPSLVQ